MLAKTPAQEFALKALGCISSSTRSVYGGGEEEEEGEEGREGELTEEKRF